ncbi:hypothetical protein [Actinoplanes sp. NPDC051851]
MSVTRAPAGFTRIADTLIAEAEARTAALKAYLEELKSGGRLCEM